MGCVGKQPVIEPLTTSTPSPTPFQITLVPTPTSENTPAALNSADSTAPIQYRAWIDSDYGFYDVRAIQDNASYQLALTLIFIIFLSMKGILSGGLIMICTIIPLLLSTMKDSGQGKQRFWNTRVSYLKYKFNKTGIYTFYVKEFPKIAPQKITVK